MEPLSRASITIALALAFCGFASGQGGPPMITDDTGTVEKGHFEINTAFTMEVGADGRLWGTPLVDFNYGTSKNTQIKVEIPYEVLHTNGQKGVRGLGNTNIGVRWRFRDGDEKGRLALSVYPQIEFNTPGSAARRLGIVDRGPEFLCRCSGKCIGARPASMAMSDTVSNVVRTKRSTACSSGRRVQTIRPFSRVSRDGWGTSFERQRGRFQHRDADTLQQARNMDNVRGKKCKARKDPRFIGYAGVQWTF